jgi:hypothetical protein
MAAKLTRLTHKIAIQLHLVAESCTICCSCSRRPVRKLLDTPTYGDRAELGVISDKFIVKGFKSWFSGFEDGRSKILRNIGILPH